MSAESHRRDDEGGFASITILTVADVARVTRLSKMTVYRLIHSGELPSLKLGASYRVTQTALDLFLERAGYTPVEETSR